jgi:hypothetical protein
MLVVDKLEALDSREANTGLPWEFLVTLDQNRARRMEPK